MYELGLKKLIFIIARKAFDRAFNKNRINKINIKNT